MEGEDVGEDPSHTLNGRLDSPTSTGDRPSTPEGLVGPGAPPNTPRSTTSSTADTLSLPRSLPTLGENGSTTTSNTSSLPSIYTPRSPIMGREGRLASLNERCRRELLRTSSESSMSNVQEEVPWIPPQCIVGGSVMDDSRHRFIVSDNDIDSEDSIVSIEQPTTSQTTVMIDQIVAFIRPRLKQNIDLYSELYPGPKMVKELRII